MSLCTFDFWYVSLLCFCQDAIATMTGANEILS